jgi:RNA polymerase sigma factor for flagellar operon FliA
MPERERLVITLYYYEELTLKEISNVMNVSESRISQMHTKAIEKMKKSLKSYING